MSNDTINDLLREVADAVEPGDRLDAIRAATDGVRRTGRGWWAAGGVGLVAASVVTALALTHRRRTPRLASPARRRSRRRPRTPGDGAEPGGDARVPVYFVGDTPSGPRLYREFQRGTGPMSAETFALDAALAGGPSTPTTVRCGLRTRSPRPT